MRGRSRVAVDGRALTMHSVIEVVRGRAEAALAAGARRRMLASRRTVERIAASDEAVYGVNTGFGDLATVTIPEDERDALQANLVRSHACGVGPPFAADEVRAMLLLRANALALGRSGVRPEVADALLAFLSADIVPVVPSQGSVGASGDLAPLAHLALGLLGEGEVLHRGRRTRASAAISRAGLRPLRLRAKEGLALVNGTQAMTAVGLLALHDAFEALADAEIAAGMALEALMGTDRAFDPRILGARPYPGAIRVGADLRALTAGSEIIQSHHDCGRVQDAYSLRCIPQILGAALDAFDHARDALERDANSANDNPLVFGGDVVMGGNFHGEPLALPLAYASLAVHTVGLLAERRIARLVDPKMSELPAFLAESPGTNSGFMIPQYVAASLVSENKVLVYPASADSIPTSAGKEDVNSNGTIVARHLRRILENVRRIVAIEYLLAAQALDFKAPLAPGRGSRAAHRAIRRRVRRLRGDRNLAPDMEAAFRMVVEGDVRVAVERAVGPLKARAPRRG
ncbi:MAG: histidine ammonia-lyase [Methanobacteriota archaeon]